MLEFIIFILVVQLVIIFLLLGKIDAVKEQFFDLKDEFYHLKNFLQGSSGIEKIQKNYYSESLQTKKREEEKTDTVAKQDPKVDQPDPEESTETKPPRKIATQDIVTYKKETAQTIPVRSEDPTKEEAFVSEQQEENNEQGQTFEMPQTHDSGFLKSFFSLDNILVKLGAIVLFFGLAFLAKLAIESGYIGIKTRFAGLAVVGIVISLIGYAVRNKNRIYSMIMQGLGIAVLYLTIYSASKFYGIFSLESAFVLMLIVVIIGSLSALAQDSLELAVFSIVGGFMAPILAASHNGNYKLLFGYYALLNIGIFIMSYQKAWRVLNWVGFTFTFVISTVWGVLQYTPDKFAVSESFLLFNFLLYLSISILFAQNRRYNPKGVIDTTLTFGLPSVVFSLQHFLVGHMAYGDAISASAFALLYVGLWFVFRNKKALLSQSYLAIGIIFVTMAIAYYFSQNVTSMLWAFEGSLVIWLSVKQDRKISRYFGEAVLMISAGLYVVNNLSYDMDYIRYFGYITISIALVFASLNLKNTTLEIDAHFDKIFFGAGALIATLATKSLLGNFVDSGCPCLVGSIFVTSVVLYGLYKWTKWEYIENLLYRYIPLGLGVLLLSVFAPSGYQQMSVSHAFVWLIYGVFGYFLLYEFNWKIKDKLHILNFIYMDVLLTNVLYHNTNLPYKLSFVIPSVLFAILFSTNIPNRLYDGFEHIYKIGIRSVLLLFLALWQLMANHYMPDYRLGLPLLNLLEMIQIIVLLLIAYYAFKGDNLSGLYTQVAQKAFFILSFVFVTIVYARAVAHYTGLPYDVGLIKNATFQTGLSIIWAVFGIAFMLLSKRNTSRTLWVVGMALLLVVVAKLFLIDLANSATIQRVISFIAVGALMLLIGYFVPIPPDREEENGQESK